MVKPLALLPVVMLVAGCGSGNGANSPSPSATTSTSAAISAAPSPQASPVATSLRLVYRAWDGNQYSIAAANADGSNRAALSGPGFAHPDLIRFVESRNRRWAAWADSGTVRVAASGSLSASTTVTTAVVLSVLAVSEDGDSVAYQTHTGSEATSAASLYVAHVHDRSVKLLRTFAGPLIMCLGDAAFDDTAKRLIAVGCGAGKAVGLLLLNVADGSIISEDDGFSAWPNQWAFAQDLATVWVIDDSSNESDIVRYDTATRNRHILYRSPSWRQADGSVAPNLSGPLVSPDGKTLAFSRYPADRVPEVYTMPSSGGTPTAIFKASAYSRMESWSPDGGYVALSVDNSTPAQRLRLIDPGTKAVVPVNTGTGYAEFLAWIVA
jgi:hypothetical protein